MEEDTPSDISSIDLSESVTVPSCSPTNCLITEETNTLQCSVVKCSRHVHFKCSQLPAYQVQAHLNSQRNKTTRSTAKSTFICFNCVEVSKDIVLLCQGKEEELKKSIEQKDKELNHWKVKYNTQRTNKVEEHTVKALDKKIKSNLKLLGRQLNLQF